MSKEDEKKQPDYYNVDSYIKDVGKEHRPRSLPVRIVGRTMSIFDPSRGFWIVILAIPLILLLPIGLLLLGVRYGPIGFYGGLAVTLTLGTYIIEKRYGKHLQVGEFPLLKKSLALVPALLIFVGIFLLMLHLAGKL